MWTQKSTKSSRTEIHALEVLQKVISKGLTVFRSAFKWHILKFSINVITHYFLLMERILEFHQLAWCGINQGILKSIILYTMRLHEQLMILVVARRCLVLPLIVEQLHLFTACVWSGILAAPEHEIGSFLKLEQSQLTKIKIVSTGVVFLFAWLEETL